jgi:hypothetical protein
MVMCLEIMTVLYKDGKISFNKLLEIYGAYGYRELETLVNQ